MAHRQGQAGAGHLERRVRRRARQYKGKVTAYDSPIYIADAAVYLKATQPDLGIDNPYELDEKQFNAAVDLLKQQRENIGEYWSDYTKEQAAFASGDSVVGTTWQVIANLLEADKVPVKTVLPKEGSTGWSDTWMISSEGQEPELHVHVDGPHHLAEGERRGGRVLRRGAGEREVVRADGGRRTTATSTTPTTRSTSTRSRTGRRRRQDCGDDRGDVCKDYSEWVQAWTEIKG